MRPLELRLRNFRSYFGADAVFDLRHRGLVGVVGPIGSGKSSLLDAIAFALYGRTPTVAASTKALIHQRADGATVSLRFAVDDEVWEVTRALRRRGQSVHGLVRLEADEPDAAKLDSLVLESEVNERIAELLGLEFGGFSRSIMLAQGRFAEFLRARPAERDKVLKGVFGHDRIDLMRAAAKELASAAATAVAAAEARLEVADGLARTIAADEESLTADEARLEVLRKAEPELADLAERVAAASRVIAHATGRLEELASLSGRMPPAAVVDEVVAVSKSATETRQRLGEALAATQAGLTAAEAALNELDPPLLREKIEEATRLEERIQQIDLQLEAGRNRRRAQQELQAAAAAATAAAAEQVTAATAARDARQQELEKVTALHAAAAQRLHAARHGDMAGTLRAELIIGEPCPVCDRPVAELPPAAEAAATVAAEADLATTAANLEAAQRALREAEDQLAQCRVAAGAAEAEHQAAVKESGAAEEQQRGIEAELQRAQTQLADLVAPQTTAELRAGLAAAEEAAAEARKRVELARREHDESIRAAQNADKELGSLRLTLAELATRLSVELGATDDVDGVAAAVGTIRAAWTDATDTLTTAKQAAEQEAAEVAAAERRIYTELEIEGEFALHLAQVGAAIELRRERIEAGRAELAASAELQAERAAASRRKTLYERLAAELTDSKFVRYLLDEEKHELARLGSEHFERLSSGRYRFSGDGEFNVVDLTAADAIRKADSLSGGETFLASLALAISLAEMVARTGGRLDAFFLDEGFGTLDPEHLDLAMEGIEQLAAGAADRLVLVVSHVTELRHRLEDLIELDKDPVTGDTIVVRS